MANEISRYGSLLAPGAPAVRHGWHVLLATAGILAAGVAPRAAAQAGTQTAGTAAASATRAPTPASTIAPAGPAATPPVTSQQVLRHLRRTIAWYRELSALGQASDLSRNGRARDRLERTSVAAVQFAFVFAHAAAKIIDAAPRPATPASVVDSSDGAARLERTAGRIATRVAALEARVATVDTELAHAPASARPALTAQRSEAAAALNLSLEVQRTILQLQQFATSVATNGASGGSLSSRIATLQRSVPEAISAAISATGVGVASPAPGARTSGTRDSNTASVTAAAAPAGSPEGVREQPTGLVALTSAWLALRGARRELDVALRQTDALSAELDTLRGDVSKEVRGLVRTSLSDTTADSAETIANQHQLETAAARFKELSTLLVPLGEQDITMDEARATLADWGDILDSRASSALRSLLLHLLVLIASIVAVLVISEVWRRATFRYLRDARRRRQFLVLRRVIVAFALLIILVVGFVSELGSLATYIGFLTAGLALALQNVILAVVAYFFLIGRYGVRVGDRVTLAGVTGRVIDIGLVRIYLMELAGPELQSTGRIVVLSNAVLFQPAALFKQIPGADYVWHAATFTLAPTTDVQSTRARLKAVAASVYATYRPSIDEQHAAVQRLVDFDTSQPEPEVDVRFTERALEFVVRYPVLPEHAAATDQEMIRALREAIGGEAAPVVTVRAATPAAVAAQE